MKDILEKLLKKQDLNDNEMSNCMDSIMSGEMTQAQIAAILVALRMKGESIAEVAKAAEIMRRYANFIDAGCRTVVDTCGTGGDGASTFNISTTTAFVAAGAGLCVAKHGNRAVSSKCGSADVLKELGVKIDAAPAVMEQCIQEHGIGFLFAPNMHPAMKHVMPTRRELGVRTIFNMLGPLTNPAGATGQVLGVFSPELTEMFANALKLLGTRRALVVHGEDGLDEITVTGRTRVCELRDGNVRTYDIEASMLLEDSYDIRELAGGEAVENAQILRGILNGEIRGAKRDVVLLNAAAAIVVGEQADDLASGIEIAKEAIDSGKALQKLEILITESNN